MTSAHRPLPSTGCKRPLTSASVPSRSHIAWICALSAALFRSCGLTGGDAAMTRSRFFRLSIVVLLVGGIAIAAYHPARPVASDYVRNPSHAIAVDQSTALKAVMDPEIHMHPGLSGFRLVSTGKDSLLLRLALVEAAEKSLDVQYYIIERRHDRQAAA